MNETPQVNSLHSEKKTEKEHWKYEPPLNPIYIGFLRVFGAIQCLVAVLACLTFFVLLTGSQRDATFPMLVSLGLAIEGFLAYGLLNAIADIAENMRLVGWYVKKMDSTEK